MNWSHFQQAIFKAVAETSDSLIIEAVAGSGKTTTIVEAINHVPREQKVVFLAFNKAIQQTLAGRVTAPNAQCLTLHAMGLRAWKRFIGSEVGASLKVDGRKTWEIAREVLSWEERKRYGQIPKLVGLAKQVGLVPNGSVRLMGQFRTESPCGTSGGVEPQSKAGGSPYPARLNGVVAPVSLSDLPDEPDSVSSVAMCRGLVEDTDETWLNLCAEYDVDEDEVRLDLCRRVLRESIERSQHTIDFDDMLLMPVITNAPFEKFDVVFVDEVQDLNGIQIEMVSRMVQTRMLIHNAKD